jgi:plastocyanin
MRRIGIKIGMVCAALVLAAAVAACGDESSTTPEERDGGTATATASPTATAEPDAGTPATPSGATISIANMAFGAPITVAPGTQVTVKNDDSAEHSVTSQTAGQFDVHVDGNQQATLTAPSEPGEYAFYCVYHPSMKGTLIVR